VGRKSNNSIAFTVGNKTSATFAESRSWKNVIQSVAVRQKRDTISGGTSKT